MDTSADPEVAEGSTEEGDTATSDKEKEKTVADEPVLELVDSMFDTYRAESFEANIKYMSEKHDFFIPNLEYVVDLEGLVRYLQLKVGNFFTCLRCNKAFYSLEAVRAHMDDKAHKAVDYSDDGQLELGEFYDFSSTYPDNDMITDEERDADLTMAVPTGVQVAYREGFELVLPSGKRAGHRDLQRYYRQRFKPEDTRDSVRIAKLVAEYVYTIFECLFALLIYLFFLLDTEHLDTQSLGRHHRHCVAIRPLNTVLARAILWMLALRPTSCSITTVSKLCNKLSHILSSTNQVFSRFCL